MLGVRFCRFPRVVRGVLMMTMSGVSVMSGLLVVSSIVVLCRLAVMTGCVLVMLRGLLVVV
jgi:hypothetical protein